jgi:hypothetical protein
MFRKSYPYLAAAILIAWLGSCASPARPSPTAPIPTTQAPASTETPVPLRTFLLQVVVSDQSAMSGTVVISSVVAFERGWLAINTDQDGSPGIVIGYSPVAPGVNNNVAVTIDLMHATSRLWAVLHVDKGTVGTWEFPGPDVPVEVSGKTVMSSFNVTLPPSRIPIPQTMSPLTGTPPD